MVATAEEAEIDGEIINTSAFPEQTPEHPHWKSVCCNANGSILLLQITVALNETDAALTSLF